MEKKPIKVLLIEDDNDYAGLIQAMIKRYKDCDFNITHTTLLQKGLNLLNNYKYDVLILDLSLPDSEASDTFPTTLKGHFKIPIVILTGISEKFAAEAVKLGAQDYLIKGEFNSTTLARSLIYAIERKRLTDDIKRSEEKYRNLYETMVQGVVYQNADGEIISANNAAQKILGLTIDQMQGRSSFDPRWKSIHEDGSDFHGDEHPAIIALNTGKEVKNVIMGVFNPSKEDYTWIIINAVPQFKPGESKPNEVFTTFEDFSLRKIAEDELKSSIKEKKALLQEIHHRVKNNMQIISSLLNLQADLVDVDMRGILDSCQNRVKSMALVHEKLYRSQNLSKIEMADYIESLVSYLVNQHLSPEDHIKYIVEVEDIEFNIETAIPCGLMINELVSNSLKYAFTNVEKGEIQISLKKLKADKFELIIKDNGIGLPDDLELENMDSLGLKLAYSLISQIEGELVLDRNHGTKFKITFKELEYKNRI